MSFRNTLKGFIDKAEKKWNDRTHPTPSSTHPPPIPTASKPQFQPSSHPTAATPHQPQCYWAPNLNPSTPLTTSFTHDLGAHGWGNAEAQLYTSSPANSFPAPTATPTLILRAFVASAHPDPAKRVTSARLSSRATLGRARGCLTARVTAPVARGVWPALWLLPREPLRWPQDGEIDVLEAWDGAAVNHSCLHWGHFDGAEWDRHRVVETAVAGLAGAAGVRYEFAWEEDGWGGGRLVWVVDGVAVMRAEKPVGTRPMAEFRVVINVAVGGNVCGGRMPVDGCYEMVVRELGMWDAPPGGWETFERWWSEAKEGHTM